MYTSFIQGDMVIWDKQEVEGKGGVCRLPWSLEMIVVSPWMPAKLET